jgi:hypothetical protein
VPSLEILFALSNDTIMRFAVFIFIVLVQIRLSELQMTNKNDDLQESLLLISPSCQGHSNILGYSYIWNIIALA